MLFDCGDALKRVIDLLAVAGNVLEFLHEVVEIAADRFQLSFHTRDLLGELIDAPAEPCFNGSKVVFGGHVLDDVAERLPYFFGCRFLGGHMLASIPCRSTVHGGGSRSAKIGARKLEKARSEIAASVGHGFWKPRTSRISGEGGRAGRGVEPRDTLWSRMRGRAMWY